MSCWGDVYGKVYGMLIEQLSNTRAYFPITEKS